MNTLKSISSTPDELRVGNHIVLFGGKDLHGEYFTKNTAFESAYTRSGVLHVDFEHGYDMDGSGNDHHNILGVVDWKSAKVTDLGLFVERVLNRRAEYVQYLEELIADGLIGTSSEAVAGKAKRTGSGEITEWPLMRDSLTVTPAEPRMINGNSLNAIKSLKSFFPSSKTLKFALGEEILENEKSRIEEISDLKTAEKFLRDLGMSKHQSTAFMSRIKNLGQRDADEGMRSIKEALQLRGAILP